MSTFLAKSGTPIVTLEQHTQDVIRCANTLFELYGARFTEKEKRLIQLACEYHDLGKLNAKFQMKLQQGQHRMEGEIPHGILSTLFINPRQLEKTEGLTEAENRVLITAVKHHHARSFSFDKVNLAAYLETYLTPYLGDYFDTPPRLFKNNPQLDLYKFGDPNSVHGYDYSTWLLYLCVKGILNKADYTASHIGEVPIEIPHPSGEQALSARILRQIQAKGFQLYPAQTYLKDHQGENVVLVAPAGSGKTEGSLLWLGEQKGFYTLPFKVSSNAIYQRVQTQYTFEEVALLHSDAFSQLVESAEVEEEGLTLWKYDHMKRLAYPLTVCTVDQLFKFVFKTLGTEIQAATLKYSAVIIDEIQMYSPRLMAFLCYGLKVIHDLGGRFLVMTATLPPMIIDYFERQRIPFQCPPPFVELNAGCRHRVALVEGEFEVDTLLQEGRSKRVLILCNTIAKAQALYQDLREQMLEEETLHLLHSRFIKKHRQALEDAILAFAPNQPDRPAQTGIWVATQIVEASLDIDFDILHTEHCTMDSLIQRMGRCYRNRAYPEHTPNIFVYRTQNGRGTVYDKDLYDFSWEALQSFQNTPLTEADKLQLMATTFELNRLKTTAYYQEFEDKVQALEALVPGHFTKSEGDHYFRDMRTLSLIPDRIYHAHHEQIQTCLLSYQDKGYSLTERLAYKNDLLNHALSLTVHGKLPVGVDTDILDDGTLRLHRSRMVYEFDDQTLRGRGLLAKELEEDNFL